MATTPHETIESTFEASSQGRIHFGQVVGALNGAGVESYHVDYRAGRNTVHLHNGDTVDLLFERPAEAIAAAFDAAAIRAVILGAQQGRVMYPEFKRLSQQAGCVGYSVWLSGRHVVYHGRRGETHVERFPD